MTDSFVHNETHKIIVKPGSDDDDWYHYFKNLNECSTNRNPFIFNYLKNLQDDDHVLMTSEAPTSVNWTLFNDLVTNPSSVCGIEVFGAKFIKVRDASGFKFPVHIFIEKVSSGDLNEEDGSDGDKGGNSLESVVSATSVKRGLLVVNMTEYDFLFVGVISNNDLPTALSFISESFDD